MINTLTGKRVLFVFDCLELGGAERQALLLAGHLREVLGVNVSVLGLSEEGGRVSELCAAASIPCHGVRCNLSGTTFDFLKILWRVLKDIRHLKPDIILPYTWRPNIVCGLLWRFSGARVCVWNQRDEGRGLDSSFWCHIAVKFSSFFVSNSGAGKEFLMQNYGLHSNRVKVISNGIALAVPDKNRSEWRQELGISERCFVVCMVANLHQYKDHATLIKALRNVFDSVHNNSEIMLILPGRFSGTERQLKEMVSELDMEDRVRFLGKVADISGLLHCADLYVHSSKAEGVPNAILEAMAAGLPVIATDISGNREAVGDDGFYGLVPAEDASVMAEKIIEFMKDKMLRERMGRVLKERVGKDFALSTMICSTVHLLECLFTGSVPDDI